MDNSPLARLPAELRNTIYELSLTSGTGIVDVWRSEVRQWHPPPLLLACCQIRHEASSIYYTDNTFAILRPGRSSIKETHWVLATWLRALPSPALSCIRRVRLRDYMYHYSTDHIAPRIKMCKDYLKREGVELPGAEISVLKTPENFFTQPYISAMYPEAKDDVWATA